jgi:solute carrier family 35 protein E1
LALRASGGAAGFPFTIATCQLLVGSVYAVFLWIAPDARAKPTITYKDWVATLPVSFAAACAHAGSVFALSAGALSFGQIVKAAEPAFAAGVGTFVYGSKVSTPRVLCLIPIIGGVALSSMAELDFAWSALVAASVANSAAAFRGNENKKLFATAGIKDRLGSVGNQFAVTTINALLFLMPLACYREGHKFHVFLDMVRTDSDFMWNVILSGWWFYIYNEVATVIIEKTGPVSQSVANTAKRAIVIVLGGIVLGESLNATKLIGCSIAIAGVFLYSEVDKIAAKFNKFVTPTKIMPPLA